MADTPDHPQVDLTRPNLARIYDYFLGGSLNNARDRKVAARLETACPVLPDIIRQQRRYLQGAIQQLLELGVRQFVDLGSGLPTAGHIHQITRTYGSDCRVVYVDNDPVTVAHSRIILEREVHATAILGDIRRPTEIVRHEALGHLINPQRAVGVTMIGILEHLTDQDNPSTLISSYRTWIDATAYIGITLLTQSGRSEIRAQFSRATDIYRLAGATLVTRPQRTLQSWIRHLTAHDHDNLESVPPSLLQFALVR